MKRLVFVFLCMIAFAGVSLQASADSNCGDVVAYGSPGAYSVRMGTSVTSVRVTAIGGGGGGGGFGYGGNNEAGRNGLITISNVGVNPGETLTVYVGGGGTGGGAGDKSCGSNGWSWSGHRHGYGGSGGWAAGTYGIGISCSCSFAGTGGTGGGGGASSAVVRSGNPLVIGGGGHGGQGGMNEYTCYCGNGCYGYYYPSSYTVPYSSGGNPGYGAAVYPPSYGGHGQGGGAGATPQPIYSQVWACDEYGACGYQNQLTGYTVPYGGNGASGYVRIEPLTYMTENCADGVDNDCDGSTDCADSNCNGQNGPSGRVCCQGGVGYCPQTACTVESCSANECYASNRGRCDGTECSVATGYFCSGAGAGSCSYFGTTESNCADGVDNDCDGIIDCADSNCAGQNGPNGRVCCPGGVGNCPQTACTVESCSANECYASNRGRCDATECGGALGYFCSGAGAGSCSNFGTIETSCTNGVDDDCNGLIDCVDPDCAGLTGPGGVRCCQGAANCIQQECGIEACNSNVCSSTSRPLCDATECAQGKYCETSTGLCKAPDESSDVCLSCAPDQTSGFSWTNGNHQDAGKGYGAALFNSNSGVCTGGNGLPCFDSNGNAMNHQSALATGNCCGDDLDEFYKPDFFGAECTSNVNDCVWSNGNSQQHNTGNGGWWCFDHEWGNCDDAAIGSKMGGATCAGVVGLRSWTIHSQVLPENQYSCTDSLDNDGDGSIDCEDTDCAGTIKGTIENVEGEGLDGVIVKALRGNTVIGSTTTIEGDYALDIKCSLPGTYTLSLSHLDYASITKLGITLNPNEEVTVDFTGANAIAKADSCESDCTFPASDIVHSSCNGINGCSFFDALTAFVCDNAQPGWTRKYDDSNVVMCPNGPLAPKPNDKAFIDCEKQTVGKASTPVLYNGKMVKMVVVSCG